MFVNPICSVLFLQPNLVCWCTITNNQTLCKQSRHIHSVLTITLTYSIPTGWGGGVPCKARDLVFFGFMDSFQHVLKFEFCQCFCSGIPDTLLVSADVVHIKKTPKSWISIIEYWVATVLQVIQIQRNLSSAHLKEINTAQQTKSRYHAKLFAEKASPKTRLAKNKLKVRSYKFPNDNSSAVTSLSFSLSLSFPFPSSPLSI